MHCEEYIARHVHVSYADTLYIYTYIYCNMMYSNISLIGVKLLTKHLLIQLHLHVSVQCLELHFHSEAFILQ